MARQKEVSTIFSIEKTTSKDGELTDDGVLADAVMEAAKADVINGDDGI